MQDTMIWASDATVQDCLIPPEQKIKQGWERSEKPPHQWFNWYMNRTDKRLTNMEEPVHSYMQRWDARDRTDVITAHSRFDLPVRYIVGGNHLRVYLDGILCEPGEDAQYVECGDEGTESSYIRWNDDIDVEYDIRIEIPVRGYAEERLADNEMAAQLQALTSRVSSLEEPIFCTKFDSPANTRLTDIQPGYIYVLPEDYVVGGNMLQVYVDGILQYEGKDYAENGTPGLKSNDIKILKEIPVSANIRTYISIKNGERYMVLSQQATVEYVQEYVRTHAYAEHRVDITTADVIKARADFAVPEYTVGNNSLKVFKDGLLMVNGRDYNEDQEDVDTSTNIFWLADVPAGSLISIIIPVFEVVDAH